MKKETIIYIITVIFTISIILNIICFATFLPIPQSDNLRDFNNMLELKTFLAISTIDQRELTETYKCVQLARDLVEEARQCGYSMSCYYNQRENHVMCCTYICSVLYVIEPQTDEIEYAIGVGIK